ncbi:ATP-binding protein [Candidatus Synechococcus calcipolaris G9]|uniref:histidine kinase n=1 Tax=Candidatus Synechococcus calcipolaris G9 TaxID=1497997 RepID=A0ABT6EW54_9SYNE|nr:PAS domain-containing sensor histidine kinase [Candidatus Synechococcus calcipolaris]MDG2989358.1 ATP-binding protein [Candidatus Synechococcus calcipolaris G9]
MNPNPSFTTIANPLAHLEAIVQLLREPFLVLDDSFHIKTCNPAFCHVLEMPVTAILDQDFFGLDQGQWDHPPLRALLMELKEHQRAFQDFELCQSFSRLGDRTFLIDGQSLPQEYPVETTMLLGIRDISDRKRAELKLEEFNRQLIQSNRELQDFASVASHDLQEPLRKIQAFTDLLATELGADLSETGRGYMDRIQNAASRMQTLINDLLSYARVTTKANPFVPIDMEQIVAEVLSDLEFPIQQSQATIQVDTLYGFEADPLQIRLLLQNLISNGLKFQSCDRPPQIRISMEYLTANANFADANATDTADGIQLRVQDNGIGFKEKYLDRIFGIFQRLHSRNEYPGTGIGLAICRKIVERHNGTITATSDLGSGATFIITMPVKQPVIPSL